MDGALSCGGLRGQSDAAARGSFRVRYSKRLSVISDHGPRTALPHDRTTHSRTARPKAEAMPPKKSAREPAPAAAAPSPADAVPPPPLKPVSSSAKSTGTTANWDAVLVNIYQYYMKETPQRTKLIDLFLLFLAVVGGLQFLYCVLAGNYARLPRAWRRGTKPLTWPHSPLTPFFPASARRSANLS